MTLFGPKFKPGDRVRYVGSSKECQGLLGVVLSERLNGLEGGSHYRALYDVDTVSRFGWGGKTLEESMEKARVSLFEKSLRAYIAAEKLALGIS